jgi:hypothetical protein
MSTRAQVRFATREDGVSFSEHPDKIHAQFYIPSDGYPEGLGLQIACSISKDSPITSFYGEIEELQTIHGDLEYIYYIWQAYDKSTWISIFEVGYEQSCECCGSIKTEDQWQDNCIFVGKPKDLITKYGSQLDESHYKLNTNDDG